MGAVGVLGLLEDTVAQVWERNVARHDPDVAGDTPVTLGITSSENLRTVLLRAAPEWEPRGVLIGAPWNSLAVAHEAVVLHLMKAPDGSGSRPDFATLRWVGEVRGAAATDNGLVYAPAPDDRTGQLWFDGLGVPPPEAPEPADDGRVGLRHVVLVWTGDPGQRHHRGVARRALGARHGPHLARGAPGVGARARRGPLAAARPRGLDLLRRRGRAGPPPRLRRPGAPSSRRAGAPGGHDAGR